MPNDILAKLEHWAEEERIHPYSFDCPQYQECQASREGLRPLNKGRTCRMSYIGQNYGQTFPPKVAIVGMDHRDEEDTGSYTECQQGMEAHYYYSQKPFNQHYCGVIRTAAALFGHNGAYCMQHCYPNRRCMNSGGTNDERCVLLSIAQPNIVKCVAAEDGNCQATNTMYMNCSAHLAQELRALAPNIVVFHGKEARWAFPHAVRELDWNLIRHQDGPVYPDGTPAVALLNGPGISCHAIFLNHPSRGHLAKQWSPVVEPSIFLLRELGALPPA